MANSSMSTASTSSPKAKAAGSADSGGFAVTKRLRKELMTLMVSLYESAPRLDDGKVAQTQMTPTPGVSAFPESDANLFKWAGTLTGPDGTVYEGLTYRLSLTFPPEYPYKPPTIKFDTPCYHPILQDKWSAVYSVHTVLVSLQSLLGDPNNASPLNVEAAELWVDQSAFKEKVVASYRPL